MQPEKQAACIQCVHNSSRCRIRLHSQVWDGRVGCNKLSLSMHSNKSNNQQCRKATKASLPDAFTEPGNWGGKLRTSRRYRIRQPRLLRRRKNGRCHTHTLNAGCWRGKVCVWPQASVGAMEGA